MNPEVIVSTLLEARSSRRSRFNAAELERRAIEHFGLTHHIDAGSGYVLTDGQMLLFGQTDHREINSVFPDRFKFPKGYKWSPKSGSSAGHMLMFMDITHALRVRPHSGDMLSITLIHPATYYQIKAVLQTRRPHVRVTWLTADYDTVDNREFDMPYDKESLRSYLQGRAEPEEG